MQVWTRRLLALLNKPVRFDLPPVPPIPPSIYRAVLLSWADFALLALGYMFYIERVDATDRLKHQRIARFIEFEEVSGLWFYSDRWLYQLAPDWVTAARFDMRRTAFDRMAVKMGCREAAGARYPLDDIRGWRPWWHPDEADKLKSYRCAVGHILVDINVDALGPDRYRVWLRANT